MTRSMTTKTHRSRAASSKPAVTIAAAFEAFPAPLRPKLKTLRALILKTAAATPGVGPLEETLKWGEPAYLTSQTGSGSTIRIGAPKKHPDRYAIYFNCQTNLVDTFRSLFAAELQFEGNRAILLPANQPVPVEAIAFCISAALTYHRNKA